MPRTGARFFRFVAFCWLSKIEDCLLQMVVQLGVRMGTECCPRGAGDCQFRHNLCTGGQTTPKDHSASQAPCPALSRQPDRKSCPNKRDQALLLPWTSPKDRKFGSSSSHLRAEVARANSHRSVGACRRNRVPYKMAKQR